MEQNESKYRGSKTQQRIDFFTRLLGELTRSALILKKMLIAGRTNTIMHNAYEELGRMAYRDLKDNRLQWDHPQLKEYVSTIDDCHLDLSKVEHEINRIKAQAIN